MSTLRSDFRYWGMAGITAVQSLALLPPVIVTMIQKGGEHIAILAAALITVLLWDLVFALVRKRTLGFHGLTVALIVTVFVPAGLPLWQLVLTLSLGVVLGEHIFGGRGFGFLNPATVTLSLLVFSFPQVELMPATREIALATLPGALMLLFFGLISWRIIVGVVIGLVALLLMDGQGVDVALLAIATAFGLVFLTCDPTAAASTNPGRWIYGILAGALMVLFSAVADTITPQAIVFAAFMGSVFAPLIDHLVVLANAARRRRRLA